MADRSDDQNLAALVTPRHPAGMVRLQNSRPLKLTPPQPAKPSFLKVPHWLGSIFERVCESKLSAKAKYASFQARRKQEGPAREKERLDKAEEKRQAELDAFMSAPVLP